MARRVTRAACFALAVLTLAACSDEAPSYQEERLAFDPGCDVTSQDCTVRVDATQWTLRFGPGVVALKPFPVVLKVDAGARRYDTVRAKFGMAGMSMGLNEYQFVPAEGGLWKAEVMLPICTSGRSDWQAEITLEAGARRWVVTVPFVLSSPGK